MSRFGELTQERVARPTISRQLHKRRKQTGHVRVCWEWRPGVVLLGPALLAMWAALVDVAQTSLPMTAFQSENHSAHSPTSRCVSVFVHVLVTFSDVVHRSWASPIGREAQIFRAKEGAFPRLIAELWKLFLLPRQATSKHNATRVLSVLHPGDPEGGMYRCSVEHRRRSATTEGFQQQNRLH